MTLSLVQVILTHLLVYQVAVTHLLVYHLTVTQPWSIPSYRYTKSAGVGETKLFSLHEIDLALTG